MRYYWTTNNFINGNYTAHKCDKHGKTKCGLQLGQNSIFAENIPDFTDTYTYPQCQKCFGIKQISIYGTLLKSGEADKNGDIYSKTAIKNALKHLDKMKPEIVHGKNGAILSIAFVPKDKDDDTCYFADNFVDIED